jgi:hypothetical protein
MEPHEAIALVEVVLRRLILAVIGDEWKADKSVDLARLEDKQNAEVAGRRGMIASDDLIRYLEFTQLKEIIDHRWNDFTAVLGKQKYFDTYMDRLAAFRNPTMHARPLYGFEVELVNGIAGEIRQMTGIYRSSGRGQDMTYYPTIESITDNYGRESNATSPAKPDKIPINVGDVVTFHCNAVDPQDRELAWTMWIQSSSRSFPSPVGSTAIFTWEVAEAEVGEKVGVWFSIKSNGRYHRWSNYDDQASMFFEILPPDHLD